MVEASGLQENRVAFSIAIRLENRSEDTRLRVGVSALGVSALGVSAQAVLAQAVSAHAVLAQAVPAQVRAALLCPNQKGQAVVAAEVRSS